MGRPDTDKFGTRKEREKKPGKYSIGAIRGYNRHLISLPH